MQAIAYLKLRLTALIGSLLLCFLGPVYLAPALISLGGKHLIQFLSLNVFALTLLSNLTSSYTSIKVTACACHGIRF